MAWQVGLEMKSECPLYNVQYCIYTRKIIMYLQSTYVEYNQIYKIGIKEPFFGCLVAYLNFTFLH